MDELDFSTSLTHVDWEKLGTRGHEIRIGDATCLERLAQGAYACDAISRLLLMSDNEAGCEGTHPINGNIVGGLHHALNVIAGSMQDDIFALANRLREKPEGAAQ